MSKLLCLDLELNKNTDSNDGYTTDVIQIGACIIDTQTHTILPETFNRYCKLKTPLDTGELRLSNFITKLTGIKQETIDNEGVDFKDAYKDLIKYAQKYNVSRNGVQWGGGDFEEIKFQLDNCPLDRKDFDGEHLDGYKLVLIEGNLLLIESLAYWFAPTHFDVKKLHQMICYAKNISPKSGLSKSAGKYNIQFGGKLKKHNALHDSIITAKLFLHFLKLLGNIELGGQDVKAKRS